MLHPIPFQISSVTLKYGTASLLQWLPIIPLLWSSSRTLPPNPVALNTIFLFKTQTRLKTLKQCLLNSGILKSFHSLYNTPILSVLKPDDLYYLVQDLKIINVPVPPSHPVVPNHYTLLPQIPSSTSHFTALDLKGAFFIIPLYPESYDLFVFTQEDLNLNLSAHMDSWTSGLLR